jgi:hypothetical protein
MGAPGFPVIGGVIGADHPDTLFVVHNLGETLMRKGEFVEVGDRCATWWLACCTIAPQPRMQNRTTTRL